MKSFLQRFALAAIAACGALVVGGMADARPALIPWPASVVEGDGFVNLTTSGRVLAEDAGLLPLATVLSDEIYLHSTVRMAVASVGTATAVDIVLRLNSGITADEAYRVTVGAEGILIEGKTYRGVAWGTSTLLQAIETDISNPVRVPYLTINDQPVATYRGLLIDVARQWHPVETLRPIIEMCRLYKINFIQLHLNDQQSTVFPFLAYPQLASVVSGQRRTWTRTEVVDLVKYADDRGVTLVPELEGPGHHAGNLRSLWGRDTTLDVFNENTYTGMNVLIGELCDVFASSPYIHLGGDEGSFGHLGKSAEELAYMAAQGITGNALSHYITRVDQIIKAHGKKTICWEGFGGNGGGSGVPNLPKDILVMPYESTFNPANQLVSNGFSVINTAWRPMYVVGGNCWSAEFIHDWNMWLWQHHINLNLHIQLPIGSTSVVGAQMCAWEQSADVELPSTRIRAHAMAERTWNPYDTNSYADFATRALQTDALLDHVLARVDVKADGVSSQVVSNYAAYDVFLTSVTVRMDTPAVGSIHYTIDGTTPTASSPLYTGPFQLTGADTHYEQLFYNKQSGNYGAQGYVINLKSCLIDAAGQPIGDSITLTHYWYQGAEIAVATTGLSGNTVSNVAMFLDPITVTLTASGPGVIRYTLNGGEPTATSPSYDQPLVLTTADCKVQGILWNRAIAQYTWFAPTVIVRAHLFSPDGVKLSGLTSTSTYWNTSPDLAQPDKTAPTIPANLTATVLTSRSVRLAWSASTDNLAVTGYWVCRNGTNLAAVSGTAFIDTTAEGGTTYQYTIKARDGTGNLSADSLAVTASTPPVPPPGTTVLAVESFDYAPASNLHTLNGGSGWGGPWSVGYDAAYPATVEAGNLAGLAGLVSTGNHLKFWAKGNGTIYQTLNRSFAATLTDEGQSVWLAMNVALYDSKDVATWSLTGLTSDADGLTPASLFNTTAGATPSPFQFGGVTLFTGDTNHTPHLVLVSIRMSGNADTETVTAYIDPDLSADPGTWTGVSRNLYANAGLTGFSYHGGRNGSSMTAEIDMDEIRIADGWQVAVGQDPPPSTNASPTVSITSPESNSNFNQGDTLTLTAAAADSDGSVAKVEFYQGTTKLGEALTPPFTYVWENVPAGPYSLRAKATDDLGALTTSTAVLITVLPPPDGVPPTTPLDLAATATSSSTIHLTWTASTDNVAVTGYAIYRDDALVGNSTTASFTDTGLTPTTSYRYTVKSKDAAANTSVASGPAEATTLVLVIPAAVLVEETFDYTAAANLNTLNGGSGWSGAWTVGYNASYPATIVTGSLVSVSGLTRSGNHLKFWTAGNGSTYENLDRTFVSSINDNAQTVWMAMVVGLCNAKNAATWTLTGLTTDAAGATPAYLFTTSGAAPTLFAFGGTTLFTGDANYTPHLMLLKIVMSGNANTETITAYHNPNLSADPGTWTGVSRSLYANTGIKGFAYRGGRSSTTTPNVDFHFDEFRLATTWQGAVGQPDASATTFTPVQNWRKAKFGTADETSTSGDDKDPNHNGIKNLMEYALGGDPLGHSTGHEILPQAERGTGDKLQIRFKRYTDRSDLTLTAQAADSLDGPWADLAVSAAGGAFAAKNNAAAAESGTGTTRSVIVTDFYQMNDVNHPKRFIRLKAER